MKFSPIGNSLKGIINYIYPIYKDNYDKIVTVQPSSTSGKETNWRSEALIIPTRTSTQMCDSWASDAVPNSWFMVHFHKHLISISHYSMRTQSNHSVDHPKSWKIEGSLDGENWNPIDSKNNYPELDGPNLLRTFKVTNKGRYSYFKVTQTDVNNDDHNDFDLSKIEFFGTLVDLQSFPLICSNKGIKGMHKLIFAIMFVIC